MGINLGDFGSQMNNQQAQPAGGAMPILNLKKNDIYVEKYTNLESK